MTDEPTTTPTGGGTRPADPNYAARRMLVTTLAITAIVAFGVVGWRVVRDDGGQLLGGTAGWDEIAIVDRSTGKTVTVDGDGEVVQRLVGRGRVEDVYTLGDRIALVGPTQIVIEGVDEPQIIPVDRDDTVTPIVTHDSLHLVIGRPSGGNVVIVDVSSGEVLDIGEIAEQGDPLLFVETVRSAADGSAFAVADARRFQTIVVRPDDAMATFFPSQPVAVSSERVVTSQIVGRQADIGVFDHDRESKARVPTELPAGGELRGDGLVMVSTSGSIYRIADGATEAERIGEVAVPSGGSVSSVQPTFDGERLVVTGSVFQAVIDLDGQTVFTTTFTAPIAAAAPAPHWTCLPVGGGDTFHSIVSLDTGEQVADLTGIAVTGVSHDGCTVVGERAGISEVVTADGVVPLGRTRSVTLGPDGRSVVRTTTAGRTELVVIDDDLELGDAVELTDLTPTSALVAFIDN